MLTIEEKIARSEYFAKLCEQAGISEWQEECEQIAAWLRELIWRRKQPEIIYCMLCKNRVWSPDTCKFYCGLSGSIKTDYEFCSDGKRKEDKNE